MSLAEIFDLPVTIAPGVDGSFIVYSGKSDPYGMAADKRGFTNADDLLSFLQRAAQAKQAEGELLLEVADVVKTVSVKPWPVQGIVGEITGRDGYPTRLTTAAAERIASTGDNPAA